MDPQYNGPMPYSVVAYYRFVALENFAGLQKDLKAFCLANGIWGTTLIAPEGVNGTMCGLPDNVDKFVEYLDTKFGIHQGEVKYSTAKDIPFERVKIKVKREIITMHQPEAADPTKLVGQYVTVQDWDALTSREDVLVLDTRNTYETELGIFKGAVDPQIETFKQFCDYVDENLSPDKHKNVAMYCTGGIRCEKASAFMLSRGFENVYHLKGGILKYLEEVPAEKSTWEGSCFVFDERVALEHGLKEAENVTSSHGY
jgi:UPF0176 protein